MVERGVVDVPPQDQREFVAAQPRHDVRAADDGLQAAGDLVQQPVAGRVAEGVVEGLEVVQVDVDQRHPLAALAGLRDLQRELLVERVPVSHAGDGIGMRQQMQAAFRGPHDGPAAQHHHGSGTHHAQGDEQGSSEPDGEPSVGGARRLPEVERSPGRVGHRDGPPDLERAPALALGIPAHAGCLE